MRDAIVAILTTLCVVGIQYATRYVIGGWSVVALSLFVGTGIALAVAVLLNEQRKERASASRSAPKTAARSREPGEP